MPVKIEVLESGRYMIRWDSMEKDIPGCQFYYVIIEDLSGNDILLGVVPARQGQKDYFLIPHNYSFPDNPLPDKSVIRVIGKLSMKEARAPIQPPNIVIYHQSDTEKMQEILKRFPGRQ